MRWLLAKDRHWSKPYSRKWGKDVDAGQCERFPCSMVMVLGDLLCGASQNKVLPSSQSWFSEKHGISNSFRLWRITIRMDNDSILKYTVDSHIQMVSRIRQCSAIGPIYRSMRYSGRITMIAVGLIFLQQLYRKHGKSSVDKCKKTHEVRTSSTLSSVFWLIWVAF